MKQSMTALGRWALARSQEKETYMGAALVAASLFGHQINDSTIQAVSWAGQFIGAGLIAATTKQS